MLTMLIYQTLQYFPVVLKVKSKTYMVYTADVTALTQLSASVGLFLHFTSFTPSS